MYSILSSGASVERHADLAAGAWEVNQRATQVVAVAQTTGPIVLAQEAVLPPTPQPEVE